ncbi:hypothetical protein NE398_07835 [Clostridium tertium]|uniref:SprT-like family protein n=1 Tax=Clostridium tertium TaxID=1559 RepID=A0A9X3XN09_9CLOT|nr:hypothetical protein [Clostridium tertium]MDC4240072.1 hypothetical protein [Clostridium tertium]
MSKEKYEVQFNRAVEDINRVVGVNIIEDAILKIIYDMNYKCYGTVSENNYKIIGISDIHLKDSRVDKVYNTMCHEFIHHILFKVIDNSKKITDYSFGRDDSPLFCLLAIWFNKHGFRIPQNYNVNRKFKNNIEFIKEMSEGSFEEVFKFINEFFDYIGDCGLYIKISDRHKKSCRNKEAEYGSNVLNLASDFDLKNYISFIEGFRYI